ncbi:MAG: hypothetical protein ACT6QS_07350, partial [Flavobacteriales bacterium]
RAQYLLTAISPPPQFTHDDLWNLTLTRTNTSDNYTQFYIALRIFNNSSQLEVKTNSAMLSLNNTVTVINIGNIADVQPFTINYYNATVLQQVVASGGLFPPGQWNIDFTLYGRPSDGEFTELANYSYPLIVDAFWPPMLLSPADGDTVQTPNPILTWTPAFSTFAQGNVTYILKVVPILYGQDAQQAIMANFPMYMESNIPMPLQMYPNTAQPLDSNHRYAWQVEGRADGLSLGSSEVWEFCYCFPGFTVPQDTIRYYFTAFTQSENDLYIVHDGNIYSQFYMDYKSSGENKVYVSVLKPDGLPLNNVQLEFNAEFGYNRYIINQCALNLPAQPSVPYYVLQLRNSRNETRIIRFVPKSNYNCN